MNPDTGTIMQFQSDEERKKEEERLKALDDAFIGLIPMKKPPNPFCRLCGGSGAAKSKITLKWIPCVCTNPVAPDESEGEKKP